jgi:DNA repair ATPase RecN
MAIRTSAEEAGKKLEEAAKSLQLVAGSLTHSVSTSVSTAVQQGIEALKGPILDFDKAFRRDYPQYLQDLRQSLAATASQLNTVQKLVGDAQHASGQVQQLQRSWQALSGRVDETSQALAKAARELESALDRLNETEGRWLAVRLYPSKYKIAIGGR